MAKQQAIQPRRAVCGVGRNLSLGRLVSREWPAPFFVLLLLSPLVEKTAGTEGAVNDDAIPPSSLRRR